MFRSVRVFLLFLVFLVILYLTISGNMTSDEKLISVDFEVFGKVQGVYFRKNTVNEANRLGLRGWCMNTQNDTVKGVIEGNPEKVEIMKDWLKFKGSPSSRIDKAVFTNEKNITAYTYSGFSIK